MTPLTPEQEQAVEEVVSRIHSHPSFHDHEVRSFLRFLVRRVTEPWRHHTTGGEWPSCKLCRNDLKDMLAENKRLDVALERISTLEGLLRKVAPEESMAVMRKYRHLAGTADSTAHWPLMLEIDAALSGEPARQRGEE
jgi:hypothetical protein